MHPNKITSLYFHNSYLPFHNINLIKFIFEQDKQYLILLNFHKNLLSVYIMLIIMMVMHSLIFLFYLHLSIYYLNHVKVYLLAYHLQVLVNLLKMYPQLKNQDLSLITFIQNHIFFH